MPRVREVHVTTGPSEKRQPPEGPRWALLCHPLFRSCNQLLNSGFQVAFYSPKYPLKKSPRFVTVVPRTVRAWQDFTVSSCELRPGGVLVSALVVSVRVLVMGWAGLGCVSTNRYIEDLSPSTSEWDSFGQSAFIFYILLFIQV